MLVAFSLWETRWGLGWGIGSTLYLGVRLESVAAPAAEAMRAHAWQMADGTLVVGRGADNAVIGSFT